MDAKLFRRSVEKQVFQRHDVRIKLPAHFPRYLVRQGIIKPGKGLTGLHEFTNDSIESAIAFLLEPRLTKFRFKTRTKTKSKGKTDDHKDNA